MRAARFFFRARRAAKAFLVLFHTAARVCKQPDACGPFLPFHPRIVDRPGRIKSDQQSHSTAALLIAHGSRRQAANDDLRLLADEVRRRGRYSIVEVAYLEIAEPTIPDGAERCIEQGAAQVRMLPYFLSSGAHVVEDLQRHRRELAAAFPSARFVLCNPLGLHPKLVDVVLERLEEAADAG